MQLSVRWRLTIVIAAAMVLTLLAILLAMRFTVESTLRSDLDDLRSGLDDDLTAEFEQVQAQILARGPVDGSDLQAIADSYGGTPNSSFLIFRDTSGGATAVTDPIDPRVGSVGPQPFALSDEKTARVLSGEVVSETVGYGGEGDVRVRSSRFISHGEPVGIVQVVTDAEFIDDTVGDLQRILVIVALIGIAAAIVVGYWLARGAIRPLEQVAAVVEEIEAAGLDRRINARNMPAEVQRLSDTFDAMLDRLETAFAQQRDFVMDMSHEIRTPLAALRGNIEVLLMDESIDDETRSCLERMSREVQRLVRLTANLLYSAHADAGRSVARESVDLDGLVLEICHQAQSLRPGVKLQLAHEDQVAVIGDYDLLKQVVLNLVDNALKYSQEGGVVTVAVQGDGSEARVIVADNGPGISAEELPHIFERMYRAENSERRTSGAGLGLSISNWIARAHGGHIAVESVPGQGSTFTLVLPHGEGASP